jgi:hypothetical protein
LTRIDSEDRNGIKGAEDNHALIAVTKNYVDSDESREAEANAAFIVLAVNSHDSLVEALTGLLPTAESWAVTCEINGEGPNNPAAINVRRARLALASLESEVQ